MSNPQQSENIRDRWRRWLQTLSFFAVIVILAAVLFLSGTVQRNEHLRQEATAVAQEQTGVVQTRRWPTKHAFQETGMAGETMARATWTVEALYAGQTARPARETAGVITQHAQETARPAQETAQAVVLHEQQTLSAEVQAARQSTPVAAAGDVISPESAGRVQLLARWGKGALYALLWSPDGRLLAVGTGRGVDLYQREADPTGSLLLSPVRHLDTGDWAMSLAFSPDSAMLAVGLINRRAQLWEVSTGALLREMAKTYDAVVQILFAPDGSLIFSGLDRGAAGTEMAYYVRREANGSDWYPPLEQVGASALSPDGTLVACARDNGAIDLWRVGGEIEKSISITGSITRMLFSPDGTTLAVVLFTREVQLWRVADGTLLATLPASSAQAGPMLAFTADGQTMISWEGKMLHLWSVPDGKPGGAIELGYESSRRSDPWSFQTIAPDPSGKIIALADNNIGQVSFWQVSELTSTLAQGGDGRPADGVSITTTEGYTLPATLPLTLSALSQSVLQGYMDPSTQIAFTPDGRRLLAVDQMRKAWLWDLAAGAPQAAMFELPAVLDSSAYSAPTLTSVILAADGSSAVTGYSDGKTAIWDVAGGRVVCVNNPGGPGPYDISSIYTEVLSPGGIYLAVAGDNRVVVRMACGGNLIQTFDVPARPYYLFFSPDGRLLAAELQDGRLYLWRVAEGELIGAITKEAPPWYWVAFSPDGTLVALAGTNPAVYRVEDLLPAYTLPGARVVTTAFSPDGRLLVVADGDGTVSLRRPEDGELLATLPERLIAVTGIVFSRDQRLLALNSSDGTIAVWGVR